MNDTDMEDTVKQERYYAVLFDYLDTLSPEQRDLFLIRHNAWLVKHDPIARAWHWRWNVLDGIYRDEYPWKAEALASWLCDHWPERWMW